MLNLSLFDPVTLDDGQRAAIEELLEAAKTFASAIDRLVPGSADRTLAVRNVLDANVLGARAIAHRGAGLYRNHVPQEVVDSAKTSRVSRLVKVNEDDPLPACPIATCYSEPEHEHEYASAGGRRIRYAARYRVGGPPVVRVATESDPPREGERPLVKPQRLGQVLIGSAYIDDERGVVAEVIVPAEVSSHSEPRPIKGVLLPWERNGDRFTREVLEEYARRVGGMTVVIDDAGAFIPQALDGEVGGFTWAGLNAGPPHPEAVRDVVRDGVTNVTTGKAATHEGL